jgi:hypothetical protein
MNCSGNYNPAGGRLITRDTLADIKPSFELASNIVPPPSHEPTFADHKKDVELRSVSEEVPVHLHALECVEQTK